MLAYAIRTSSEVLQNYTSCKAGRARPPFVWGRGGGTIIHTRRRVRPHGQLRRLPKCAGAHDVELSEPQLCRVKSFLGFAPAAGRAQQSNQRSLHGLIGGLEQAE